MKFYITVLVKKHNLNINNDNLSILTDKISYMPID